MFVDLFQGHGLTEVQPWVISGDFNEKPHDGVLGKLFEAYAGHYVGVGNPTRWDGNSEVDWFSTNRLQRVLQVDSCDLHFSDHIPLRLKLQLQFEETLQGTLQKFVDYSIPVDLSHNHWQVILENAWASVNSVRNLFDLLQNENIDVQKDWDEFQTCLNDVFRNAFEQVLNVNFPITSKKDVLKRTKKGLPKGDIASHKWVPWNRKRGYLDTGSIKLKQLRNRLARLCVLRRSVRENAGHETRLRSTLKKKLGLAHCDMLSLCQEISSVQTEINGIVEHERRDKLRHWKFRMKTDPKGIGNWLKTKHNPSTFHFKNDNGDVSDTLASGAQIVYEFWNQFWTPETNFSF